MHHSLRLLHCIGKWSLLFPVALLKVGIAPVQRLPVCHTRPELVCQPLLPEGLQLAVVVAVSHGPTELLVVHLGVPLDLAPEAGQLDRVADAEHALCLISPGDHTRVIDGVPQQRHDPLSDLQTGSWRSFFEESVCDGKMILTCFSECVSPRPPSSFFSSSYF